MIVQLKYSFILIYQLMGNVSKTNKLKEGAMNTIKDAFNKDQKTEGDKNAGRDVQKYCLALKNQEKSGYFATKDEGKLTMTMELVPSTQYDSYIMIELNQIQWEKGDQIQIIVHGVLLQLVDSNGVGIQLLYLYYYYLY